ncbi:MAG: hypothetical protein FOGNACKC_05069 [Anaerolineae bacterium]|nr:hypothetical protein [Anaerolineae bacterium]
MAKYDPDFDYDEYQPYRDREVTSIGLTPGQLALIIGVNAVISLIISVVVVLVANRQAIPGDIATPAAQGTTAATVSAEVAPPNPAETSVPATAAAPEVTPVESVTYQVQAGDTLGQIAQKFDVPLFDLMVANGLSDQDFIQVGQELTIPLGGLPAATPTFTPAAQPTETPLPFDPPTPLPENASVPPEPAATVGPSPTPTPTPPVTPGAGTPLPTSTTAPANQIKVTISEVIAPGELAQETLIILNQGAGTSLQNWKLTGSSLGNFVFPDIFLFSGGSIRIHTVAGQNTPSDLYLGQGEAAWPPGTVVVLGNASGQEISRYSVQ